MDAILPTTVLFTLAMALAMLVERFVEVIKSVYDYIDWRMNLNVHWTKKAHKLRDKIEDMISTFERSHPGRAAEILRQFGDKLIQNNNGVVVLSGDLLRVTSVKVAAKLLSILLGIAIAFWLDLDLVEIWQSAAGTGDAISVAGKSWVLPDWLKVMLTGVVIGLGSGPVHKIITTIEKQKNKTKQRRMEGVK